MMARGSSFPLSRSGSAARPAYSPAHGGMPGPEAQEVRASTGGLAPNRVRRARGDLAEPSPARRARLIGWMSWPSACAVDLAGHLPAALVTGLQQWATEPDCGPGERRREAIGRIRALAASPQPCHRDDGLVRNLNLSGLGLTRLPEDLAAVVAHTEAESLMLGSNALQSLPHALGNCQSLQHLGLANNRFGEVPGVVTQLRALRTLSLSGNELSSLPDAIGQLEHLEGLGLECNGLHALPEAMSGLRRLRALRLEHNRLTSLPEWVCRLPELRYLSLQSNPLATWPAALSELPDDCTVKLWDTPDRQAWPRVHAVRDALSAPASPDLP